MAGAQRLRTRYGRRGATELIMRRERSGRRPQLLRCTRSGTEDGGLAPDRNRRARRVVLDGRAWLRESRVSNLKRQFCVGRLLTWAVQPRQTCQIPAGAATVERKEIEDLIHALCDAFNQDELTRLLVLRLGRRLEEYAPLNSTWMHAVFVLVL